MGFLRKEKKRRRNLCVCEMPRDMERRTKVENIGKVILCDIM